MKPNYDLLSTKKVRGKKEERIKMLVNFRDAAGNYVTSENEKDVNRLIGLSKYAINGGAWKHIIEASEDGVEIMDKLAV